ncbi:MAG: pyrroline-5-carboxylate reductase [Sphingomonadaceae bacterium]
MSGTFWIVGCGNMGGAMLRGWVDAGLDPAMVTVIDPGAPMVPAGVTIVAYPPEGVPDTVMIAVKPQMLGLVAPQIAPYLAAHTQLLSILAGVEVGTLRDHFGAPDTIVRVMPNTPAAIRKGVLALFSDSQDGSALAEIEALMAPLGLVEWIGEERMFDAVTALSGSGPAFLFRFIDALGQAGSALGLPADQAARFALATVEGAALLATASDESPFALAERVASPGGSTRKGLDVLDQDGALVALLTKTLIAAERRNAEMAATARG